MHINKHSLFELCKSSNIFDIQCEQRIYVIFVLIAYFLPVHMWPVVHRAKWVYSLAYGWCYHSKSTVACVHILIDYRLYGGMPQSNDNRNQINCIHLPPPKKLKYKFNFNFNYHISVLVGRITNWILSKCWFAYPRNALITIDSF